MGGLTGRRALITGASAGIGLATALAFAREGANVIATGRRQQALAALQEAAKGGGEFRILAGDLRERRFLLELAEAAADVDVLVSNAGVLTYAPLIDLSPEECELMFQINVLATLQLCQEIARRMLARKRGHMIIMSSGAAREVFPLGSVYAASKHALAALTQSMRLEWEPHGIKVSEIAPGMTDTEIRLASTHPAVTAALSARKIRPISAEEIAEAVVFAASAPENTSISLLDVRPRLRAG